MRVTIMRLLTLLLSSLFATLSYAQAPQTVVQFEQLDSFTDATYENRYNSREQVSQDIAAHIMQLSERYLAPGYSLNIRITDIDLAGRYEPWNTGAYHVRFMRDITWPRIKLNYELLDADGDTILSRAEQVSDMHYLNRSGPRWNRGRLQYEKAMLHDWFTKRFEPFRTADTVTHGSP